MKWNIRVSLVRSPDMILDMSRLLDIIGGQVSKQISSSVSSRTALFDLALVTQIGLAPHPLKTPVHTTFTLCTADCSIV
jgi:hypothetical protein